MLKRKILDEINKWKNSLNIKKRALVIKGLRQIGKTTVVLNYCKKNYENLVYINFMENKSIKKIFDNDLGALKGKVKGLSLKSSNIVCKSVSL